MSLLVVGLMVDTVFLTLVPRLEDAAVALGCGSLYNHSYAPNAENLRRLDDRCIDFVPLREIAPGEEITLNYNGAAGDESPLWFEPV